MPNLGPAVKRARDAIRRIRAMEREDIREIRAVLSETRASLIARLSGGRGTQWDKAYTLSLLREVDAAALDLERALGGVLLGTQQEAAALAVETTIDTLKAQGIEPLPFRGFGVINRGSLIAAQSDAVADMITGVTEEFRTATRRDLRRALAGGLSLGDFEKRIGRALPGPGPFGTVARRAEVIVRNETADAFHIAKDAERENLAAAGFVYRKRWVTARDMRVRPSHLALDGVTVDADADFDVGGFPAARPKDPRLPPEESIQCRCDVLTEIDVERSRVASAPGANFGGRSIALPEFAVT